MIDSSSFPRNPKHPEKGHVAAKTTLHEDKHKKKNYESLDDANQYLNISCAQIVNSRAGSAKTKTLAIIATIFVLLSLIIVSAILVHLYLRPRLPVPCEDCIPAKNHTNNSTSITTNIIVGQGIYLSETDIYSPHLNGIHIFKPQPTSCYITKRIQTTSDIMNKYSHVYAFYKKIASDSGLSISFISRFLMGATLHIKTSSISTGYVDVRGVSIDVHTYVKSTYLDKNCLENPSMEFTEELMKAFDSLPELINSPWLGVSWQKYDQFLKTFGSHFVEREYYGASVRQWTFSKASLQYNEQQLAVKACIDFFFRRINVAACSDVSVESAEFYKNMFASSRMEIRGGTDETRNRFLLERSNEMLEQLLNEGRKLETPVDQRYMPIWEVLMMKFSNNKTRYGKAMHLKQFYLGFKDFGCTLQRAHGYRLRFFEYHTRSPTMPIFQCMLINKGCHSDNDCHIGGAGTVTYCYGNSCFEYKSPSFGHKAMSVVARSSEEGSYDGVINKSCRYKDPFKARCTYSHYGFLSIWSGDSITYNVRGR